MKKTLLIMAITCLGNLLPLSLVQAQTKEPEQYIIASYKDLSLNLTPGGLQAKKILLVDKPEYQVWIFIRRDASNAGEVSKADTTYSRNFTILFGTSNIDKVNPLLIFNPAITYMETGNNIPYTPACMLADFNDIYDASELLSYRLLFDFMCLPQNK